MEGTDHLDTSAIVNVATIPQRSPFRYPGGKTWLVPHIRRWLRSLHPRPRELVEPFAGGAIVGLTAIFEELVDRATLVELDADVAAVWQTILGPDARDFAERIVGFQVSKASVNEILGLESQTLVERAFATLVKNRIRYGGIIAPGACNVRNGENGRGLLSRWYPVTLRTRILAIAAQHDRIRFVHGDGVQFLRETAQREDTVYFIDPPYTVAGRRLYAHSELDHDLLLGTVCNLRGDFLMTYDNAEEIRRLATKYGLDIQEVPMKSTKHARMVELLIGRDLAWAREASLNA